MGSRSRSERTFSEGQAGQARWPKKYQLVCPGLISSALGRTSSEIQALSRLGGVAQAQGQ